MIRGNQNGFTLVEVMLATAILAVVMTLVFTAFDQTSETSRHVGALSDRYREARIVLAKFSDELMSSYQGPDGTPRLIGMDGIGANGQQADRIAYASMSRPRTEGMVGSFLHGLEYHIKGQQLIYTETPNLLAPGKSQSFQLIDGLAGFQLRYQDRASGEWVDGWNEEGAGLPAAVEVTLLFPKDGKVDLLTPDNDVPVVPLSTVIRIPMEGA